MNLSRKQRPDESSSVFRSRFIASLSLTLPLVLFATQPSVAQDQTTENDSVIEEIVVVGSLIKRQVVYEGRAPVQTLDSDLVQASGASQPVDVLKSLTANTGSYLATQQNYLQGSSQFNLRGLGLSSTLTLINGRRAGLAPVANDAGHGFFDINTLPIAMIERIEILRDGASTTYGSQAVAGVANIVTRNGFDGVEFVGGFRSSSNTAYDLGFASGFNLPRGHLNAYGSWYRQDENFRSDFDWMIPRAVDPNGDGDIVDGSFDSGRGSPGSFRRAMIGPDSRYYPFRIDGVIPPYVPDPDCEAGGGYPSGPLCRMDFTDQRTMIAAEHRAQLFSEVEYSLNEDVNLFAEIGFSANEIVDRVGNMRLFSGNVVGTNAIFVPANHPFNLWTDPDGDGILTAIAPEDWIPGHHQSVPVSYFGRPLGREAFGNKAGNEWRRFRNLRILVGTEFILSPDWIGSFHLVRSNSELEVQAERHWEADAFERAVANGSWNPFGTRLTSPNLITPKTVLDDGLDPDLEVKLAGNDLEARRLFERIRTENSKSSMDVAEFVASSDSLELSNHPVSMAVGMQFRRLDYSRQPDPLNAIAAGPQDVEDFPAASKQQAFAIFTEGLTTFLDDRAELQLALRHERYKLAGNTTDPKISFLFRSSDLFSLRASYGSSFQAPTLFQTAGNTLARTLTDPFLFDTSGVGRCTVDADGTITNRGDNFSAYTVLDGSTLQPQTAQLVNFGALFHPRHNADVSVDFWVIHYADVIAQGRSFQAILEDDCRDDGIPNDPRVLREVSGQITQVRTSYENIAVVRTNGLDLNAHWDLETDIGVVRLGADATLMTRFDIGNEDGALSDHLGNRNDTNGFGPTPELRFNLRVLWWREPDEVKVTLRFIDSYKNDEIPTQPTIDSWLTLDFNFNRTFTWPFEAESTVSVGAHNLLDSDPPPLPSGRSGDQRYNLRPGFDGFVHDIKGRAVYFRFRTRM